LSLLADQQLALFGVTISTDANGIYELGSDRVAKELDFTSAGGSIPPGFAMILNLGTHASIEKNGTPVPFATQPSGSNATLLYIADGLDPGDTLAVIPE
jgi:hypothetical protein